MPHQPHSLGAIISGGQTGVDRAALDLGLHYRITIAGWCPKGRLAEDGPIPERYPLKETPSSEFSQRTDWNVRDSDGTVVLTYDIPTGGTALTIRLAQRRHKPCLVLKFDQNTHPTTLLSWLEQHHIRRLNIAGPRESTYPGIYTSAYSFLDQILLALKESHTSKAGK